MNVLLLNPPADHLYIRDNYCCFSSKADTYWPPIDLLVLSGLLRNVANVHLVDCVTEDISTQDCIRYAKDRAIDHLIFMTGTACWKHDMQVVEQIHRTCRPKTILASGGNLLTQHQQFLDRFPFLDGVITNYAVNNVAEFLTQSGQVDQLVNIQARPCANRTFSAEQQNGFFYPVPMHEQLSLGKYRHPFADGRPFSTLMTSFGCPHTCRFCVGSILKYTTRDIDNFCEEVSHLKGLGIRSLWMCDWTFNATVGHAMRVCEALLQNRFDMNWFCQCRVENLPEELVAKMRESGCRAVQIGVESADQTMLDQTQKKITLDGVERAFRLFKKHKIKTLGYFIIGLPGDTEESIVKTAEFAKQLNCDFASFSIATPDIGTALMEECREKGWVEQDLDQFDSSIDSVIRYGSIAPERMQELRKRATRAFYFRPVYLTKKLCDIKSARSLWSLASSGLKLYWNTRKDA